MANEDGIFKSDLQLGVFETIELHRLIASGFGESEKANIIRDKIDILLDKLSTNEKTFFREVSAFLEPLYCPQKLKNENFILIVVNENDYENKTDPVENRFGPFKSSEEALDWGENNFDKNYFLMAVPLHDPHSRSVK